MGLAEGESLRIALAGQTVNDRATRISKTHKLGALVYRLSSGIVDRLTEHFHVIIAVDLDNL